MGREFQTFWQAEKLADEGYSMVLFLPFATMICGSSTMIIMPGFFLNPISFNPSENDLYKKHEKN